LRQRVRPFLGLDEKGRTDQEQQRQEYVHATRSD
jgi:hypothetical protein